MISIDKLLKSYFAFIQSDFETNEIEKNTYEITTPFLDRHNDHIMFYVTISEDYITLTDNGLTMQDLSLSGVDIKNKKTKQELDIALNGFGIMKDNNNALFAKVSQTEYARMQNNLIQAILSVNDMISIPQNRQKNSFFFDEVSKFFDDINASYTTNIQIQGKSIFSHKIDFLMTKNKNHRERLIKILNVPKKENLKNYIFSFTDLGADRANSDKILILNDTQTDIKDFESATSNYGITPISWSKKDINKDLFAA